MRISYLRHREPIHEIIEQTLTRFWSQRFADSFSVTWASTNAKPAAAQASVPWTCNPWLNVIFPPQVHRAALEPTFREYARSTVAWRRPLQGAYVKLATTWPMARWLGRGQMCVNRPLPGQEHTVIIPGNNKIRVLDHSQKHCHCVLKASFPDDHFRREVESRMIARDAGLPVPELIERNDAERWFCERYVAGTPLNRLSLPEDQQRFLIEAARQLSSLLQRTAASIDTSDYVLRRIATIQQRCTSSRLLDEHTRTALSELASQLETRILNNHARPARLTTALTHGDFQPANLLIDQHQVWIIDWEYADHRQAGFDALLSISAARSPVGLGSRLRDLASHVEQRPSAVFSAIDAPGLGWRDRNRRLFHIDLFWLEELDLHLTENSNPHFRCLNHGFANFVRELEGWLR